MKERNLTHKLRIFDIVILNTKWKDSKSRKNLCAKDFTCVKIFYVHDIAVVNLWKIYFLKTQRKHVNQTTAIYIVIGIFNLHMFSRALDIKYCFVCSKFVLYRIIWMICFNCVFCFVIFIQFALLCNRGRGAFNGLWGWIRHWWVGACENGSLNKFFICEDYFLVAV